MFRKSSAPRPRTAAPVVRSVCIALAGASILACGDKSAGDGPHADLVAEYVPRIEKELGLPFKTPPKLEIRSRDEVATFVRQQLDSERGRKGLAGQEAVYRLLGVIPDTLQLRGLMQRLLEEQIVGYYDPATEVLYVVKDAPEALVGQTVAHELVHALQDQYVRIDSIQGATDDADRQVAAQSVLEGQAVYMQMRIDPNAAPLLRMSGGWDQIRDMIRDGSTSMPVFASSPRIIREGLLFPYLGGADFVRRFVAKRPEKELFTDLPVSTRQLLDDSAYFSGSAATRNMPVTVTLPAPARDTVFFENTLGEFETRLVLAHHLKNEERARQAAMGVDGDRFAVIRGPQGDAMVWASAWDTPADAADFALAMREVAQRRYGLPVAALPNDSVGASLDIPAAAGQGARTVRIAVEQRSGISVVVYMDYPAGTAAPLDAARITLTAPATGR